MTGLCGNHGMQPSQKVSAQRWQLRRESDEEDVSASDVGGELAADEIEASDKSNGDEMEAPSRKRKAPQTALKVRVPRCMQHWGHLQVHRRH